MIPIAFGSPGDLIFLLAPAALVVVWCWRLLVRRAELRRFARHRTVPMRERFRFSGELSFWLFQLAASALLIVAVARPLVPTTGPQRAGLDLVVLQDASASMRVADVARAGGSSGTASTAPIDQRRPVRDRWQRSMALLRELGDALSWHEDRVALTVFAHLATPQIRLTRDPNTLFFFLDHLHERPPFRIEDDTTWDTNLELAVAWGLRIVEKDEEIHGRSQNAVVFVLLSDGEAWSGEVARAIAQVTRRGIPIHVVGVGTLGGGLVPVVQPPPDEAPDPPRVARLERAALQQVAAAGQGRYFELDRDGDRYIANTIVAAGRRLAPVAGRKETAAELYWWSLCGAGAMSLLGLLLLRRPAELAVVLAGCAVTAAIVGPLLF